MERAYRRMLEEYAKHHEEDVVISRDGASDLRGRIAEADDDGVTILVQDTSLPQKSRDEGGVLRVFVDYSHIRGVGKFGWDLNSVDAFGR